MAIPVEDASVVFVLQKIEKTLERIAVALEAIVKNTTPQPSDLAIKVEPKP